MTRLRIGLAQIDPTVGDLQGNVAKILDAYDRADSAGCDLVAFPELAITGYPPEDLVLKPALQQDARAAVEDLAKDTVDGGPAILIGTPWDGQPHAAGNGQMVAFLAQRRDQVDRAHALALAHGGQCEGTPGLRPHYHPDYYGAYFRDPEGNKIGVACHAPEDA